MNIMPKKSTKQNVPLYKWMSQLPLTLQDAKDLGLYKAVLIREGQVKSGEVYTAENIILGTGAMSLAARRGEALIDIDHIKEGLPQAYVDKYGSEINNPYPVGHVFDAQAIKAADGKMETQALLIVDNAKVRELLENGTIVGNSIEDQYRKLNCDGAACAYEGSNFTYNTFILEETPNANGTYIAPIAEEDIGTLIQHVKVKQNAAGGIMKIVQEKLTALHTKKNQQFAILENYLDDQGVWINGEQSIVEFLTAHKEGIDAENAAKLAAYMFNNPETFNDYQLATLSGADLVAWMNVNMKLEKLNKLVEEQNTQQKALFSKMNVLIQSNTAIKTNMRLYVEKTESAKGDDKKDA